MMTGTLKSQIDRIWDAFWSGGISNPMEVIEQMTYLLFIKRLDEEQIRREKKAARTKGEVEDPIFNKRQQKLRWSKFKELGDPAELYRIVSDEVFPFIKTLGGHGTESAYARHMKDARFTIPTPALLAKVVDMIDDVPMDDRDTKGDLYEYMLGKIASAGQNGQFRTPRHIIKLMVDMMAPIPEDTICDPACGTAGFLVAAAEYLREHHSDAIYKDKKSACRFNEDTFDGFDFDSTMLRVGAMNMLLHDIQQPSIENRDSLSEGHARVAGQYSLILANPPFAGSLDYESTAKDLLQIVKTKKTELLFLALFLRLLRPGGRAAVIVPDGVLFGSSKAHKELRRILVEEQRLDGIVSPCPRAYSALMPAYPLPSCCSPKPIAVAPTRCGSTTCRPTATAWTTNATRCPPTSTIATTCPTFSSAGSTARPKPSASALNRVSWCPRPRSSATITTCRSTATSRWCMPR